MLVRIEAGQRLDPVRPEDREHGENAAEGERPDQSNSRDGGLIASLVGARLGVSSARASMVVTVATRRYRREAYRAVQCGASRPTPPRLRLGRVGL
jgi:hypothetical protein